MTIFPKGPHDMLSNSSKRLSVLLLIGVLTACGKTEIDELPIYDNTAEVEAFYRDHTERFVFSTPEQLPDELIWQDGSELPVFGDPRAERGGRLTLRLRTMQQTLRVVGPDANGSLRGPLWSANSVNLIERHPWKDDYFAGLARQWAIDPNDSRTVYLRLDPDARWSDGKPVTVDDLFFSLYFLLSENINDPAINRVMDESVSRITRFDAETLSITQTNASPDILGGISTFIVSQRDFYREFGPDYVDRYHWRFAPVTGPYTLDASKVERSRQITFERMENWWADTKPFYRHRYNPDELTYTVIRDDNKAFEAFLKGGVDWHFLNRTALWYDRDQEASIRDGYIARAWIYHQLPTPSAGIHMNALQPQLTDRNVRIGIQHAINFEKVNEGLYRGDQRRIKSFADGYGAYSHPTLRARSFDVEKAQAYFNTAGFVRRGDDGILVNELGQRLSFVLTIANRADDPTQATILKEEAQKAGLELIIEILDSTAFFTKTFEKKHQMALTGWYTGYSPLPFYQWELRGEDAGKPSNFNTTNIKDDQLDTLLTEWDLLEDPPLAQAVSHKVQERVHEFGAWIPGLTTDYNRLGYWRWLQWPEYFQIPRYFMFTASGVFWIDQDIKRETLEAQKQNKTFPASLTVYDRWKREGD